MAGWKAAHRGGVSEVSSTNSTRRSMYLVYVDCEKDGERMEPWGRPSLKVLDGTMEPFTHTLAVWFMNEEDSHSVK